MPVQETEESNIVDQLQVVCRLDDELETSSESSDSGIDFPKFDDDQQPDERECVLLNNVQSPHSRVEKILQIFNIEFKDYNNIDNLLCTLNLLPLLISQVPDINFDGLIYREAFDFFIKQGINVNSQNKCRITLLHLAIEIGDIEAVRYLLTIKNINPFIQNNNGRTPFNYAEGKKEILRMLIEAEYKHGSTKNKFFHFAVKHNQINAVKYLVEDQGYEVDLRDCQCSTPLHVAAMEGHVDIIKYLIAKGANVNHVSRLGNTALILAVSCINSNEKNKLEIIKLLIKNGAGINFVPEKDKAFCQMSVLHFAVEHFIQNSNQDSLNIVSYLLSSPKLNVNICDDHNETVLHYVVKSKLDVNSQLKILGILLTRKDVNLSIADNKDKTPLDYAKKPILDVLCKYIKIKNNYEIANSASYCLATLMMTTSFILIIESSILLNDVVAIQDDYARYMCVGFIVMAAVGMLSGIDILICNYIEEKRIKEDFEYQIEKLIKNSDNFNTVLTQPKTGSILNANSNYR
ncbi:ankyrin repeat domain-containing protein [Candidatus Mesenet endosymbiont of Agriotes lineatus]|uniref:ankyrin repeat domain-containing protein n=1 Tax=Candidatus Mesenet endosymbiont of Agriotes lineatus TaxID=3077948 RepID=UPI0030D0D96D